MAFFQYNLGKLAPER